MTAAEAYRVTGYSESTLLILVSSNTLGSMVRDGQRFFYRAELDLLLGK